MNKPRGIAIIGLDCRFPGARDPAAFWENLKGGVESVSFFSDEELAAFREATLGKLLAYDIHASSTPGIFVTETAGAGWSTRRRSGGSASAQDLPGLPI